MKSFPEIEHNIREQVGAELYDKAAAEIQACLEPWMTAFPDQLANKAVRLLAILAWLRGYTARQEAMS